MKQKTRKNFLRALVVGLVFLIGYLGTFLIATHPMSDEEFEYCKEVAMNVYNQKDSFLLEVPNDVIVTKTDSSIEVRSKTGFGRVIGTLENGELILTKDNQLALSITINLLMGTAFLLIWLSIDYNAKKRNS